MTLEAVKFINWGVSGRVMNEKINNNKEQMEMMNVNLSETLIPSQVCFKESEKLYVYIYVLYIF
jgi:uncharacterized membrane protein